MKKSLIIPVLLWALFVAHSHAACVTNIPNTWTAGTNAISADTTGTAVTIGGTDGCQTTNAATEYTALFNIGTSSVVLSAANICVFTAASSISTTCSYAQFKVNDGTAPTSYTALTASQTVTLFGTKEIRF